MESLVKDIIKAMYAKGLIKTECAKVCKDESLCDDLAQEVTLIMLQKPESLVSELNQKGELLYYIHRVAKNQYCSETSPFYTMYKKFNSRKEEIDEAKI